MKVIRFSTERFPAVHFGVVVRDHAVSFAVLQSKSERRHASLTDSRTYLAHLPQSEAAAKELLGWGERNLDELAAGEKFPLGAVRLHEPVEVAALFDFGLTPRHLKNAAAAPRDAALPLRRAHGQTAAEPLARP